MHTLATLNQDCLFIILCYVDLDDIASLRVCGSHSILAASKMQALWIGFAKRLIAGGLPWPHFLQRLDSLSVNTLEHYVVRAYHLDSNWSKPDPRPKSIIDIQHSAGSTTWLHLHHSRWIFLASVDGSLRIFDYRNPVVACARWKAEESHIVFALVNDVAQLESVTLILNRKDFVTEILTVRLPSVEVRDNVRIDPVVSFKGFSNLLAAHDALIAFGEDYIHCQPHVVCIGGGAARLLSNQGVTKHQTVEAMKFVGSFLIVVKNWIFELYPLAPLLELERCTEMSRKDIIPIHSFTLREPLWRADFFNSVDDEAPHMLLRSNSDSFQHVSFNKLSFEPPTVDTTLVATYASDPARAHERVGRHCIGSNGKRAIWMAESYHNESVLVGCTIASAHGSDDQTVVVKPKYVWQLPTSMFRDVCRHLVIDDAVGLVVAATAQGHMYILDYATSGPSVTVPNALAGQKFAECSAEYLSSCLNMPVLDVNDKPQRSTGYSIEDIYPPPAGLLRYPKKGHGDFTHPAWIVPPQIPAHLIPRGWREFDPLQDNIGGPGGDQWGDGWFGERTWMFNHVYRVPGYPLPLITGANSGDVFFTMGGGFHHYCDLTGEIFRVEDDYTLEECLRHHRSLSLASWQMWDSDAYSEMID